VHPGSPPRPGLTLTLSADPAPAGRPAPGRPAPGRSAPGRSARGRTAQGHPAPGPVIARLRGELVIAGVPALRDELAGLLHRGPTRFVIDLSGVTRCDISGLAVLVGAGHRAQHRGGSLGLAALSPPVSDILHATGLDRYLEAFATAEAAVADADDPAPALADTGPDRAAPGRRPFAYSQAAATRLRRVLDVGRRPAIS
jgi:anti-anti-sigma factor